MTESGCSGSTINEFLGDNVCKRREIKKTKLELLFTNSRSMCRADVARHHSQSSDAAMRVTKQAMTEPLTRASGLHGSCG